MKAYFDHFLDFITQEIEAVEEEEVLLGNGLGIANGHLSVTPGAVSPQLRLTLKLDSHHTAFFGLTRRRLFVFGFFFL